MTDTKQFFLNLCKIPRPSGGESAVADYLSHTLTAWNYKPERDAANNLRCLIPATPGFLSAPCIALQAHTDMVCVAAPHSDYRPGLDPIQTVEKDGWLCSDGRSTLGADNGAAVAILLSIAQHPPKKHGPILLLFTATEEQGMVGVKALSPQWMSGVSYLINLDGFHAAPAICGSAGGLRQSWTHPILRQSAPAHLRWKKLLLSGLTGGHSGYDIGLGRGNALTLLADFLQKQNCCIADFNGGSSHNAIPAWAEAIVGVSDETRFGSAAAAWTQEVQEKYRGTDPELSVTVRDIPAHPAVWTEQTQNDVLSFLIGLPCGALNCFPDGTTANSGNPAVAVSNNETITLRHFSRSATAADQIQAETDLSALAACFHFERIEHSSYRPWEPAPDNTLLRTAQHCYQQLHGSALGAQRVHVGLECALLLEKAPHMQVIALGCNIRDAHAVTERVELKSITDLEALLRSILQTILEEDVQ